MSVRNRDRQTGGHRPKYIVPGSTSSSDAVRLQTVSLWQNTAMPAEAAPSDATPPDAVPLGKLRRALVVMLRHHGDVLLTSPVHSALKAAAPDCEIDALVYTDTAAMVEGHPAVSEIHCIDRGWRKLGFASRLSAELGMLRRLRARRYDLVVHLSESWRGAWIVRLTGARWSVAPAMSGRGRRWARAFTHFYRKPLAGGRHMVERNLDALRRLGVPVPPGPRALTLVPDAADEARVRAMLVQHALAPKSYIHMHPTSRWMFKTWPAERVAGLIDALAETGLRVVLTAAPDARELAFIDTVLRATRAPAVNLSGQLSLKELGVLSRNARLFVGVDSAPMHIAAAMATPTVGIFGPSGEMDWGPWGVIHRIAASDHPCRPCGIDGCGGGKVSECLTTLPVERVLKACRELL